MSKEKKMLEKEEAKNQNPEVYSRGYYDGYHKAYSDVRAKVNAAKKKEREEYRKKLESIEAANVYPLNMIYEITEGFNLEESIKLSPETIYQALTDKLNERERRVIEMYYRDKMTLDEIADVFSVTRERVRQIILKAERKLKHPSAMNIMRVVTLKEYKDLERKYGLSMAKSSGCEIDGTNVKEPIKAIDITEHSIEDLGLSTRSFMCLHRRGIKTIGQLMELDETDLLNIRNLGRKSAKEIRTKLYGILEEENNE